MNNQRTYRILFVDDDEMLLDALRKYFVRLGHQVFTAANGQAGISAFTTHHPDVAVVDLNLPDMSGMDVLAELKQRRAMVIMLTGMGEVEHAVEAMRLHAENFLTKPIEMSHLAIAVEKAAEKGALRRENVELKERLSPSFKRFMAKTGVFILLVAVSAVIGMAIGSGSQEDPRRSVPIPVPIDTTTR